MLTQHSFAIYSENRPAGHICRPYKRFLFAKIWSQLIVVLVEAHKATKMLSPAGAFSLGIQIVITVVVMMFISTVSAGGKGKGSDIILYNHNLLIRGEKGKGGNLFLGGDSGHHKHHEQSYGHHGYHEMGHHHHHEKQPIIILEGKGKGKGKGGRGKGNKGNKGKGEYGMGYEQLIMGGYM